MDYDIYGKGNLQSFLKSSCDEQKLRRFKLNISIQEARGFFLSRDQKRTNGFAQ